MGGKTRWRAPHLADISFIGHFTDVTQRQDDVMLASVGVAHRAGEGFMPLASEFKFNRQLQACAEIDSEHVGVSFHPKGEHVKLIRKALNAWIERQPAHLRPSRLDTASDVYDGEVARMVLRYKQAHKPPILNYQRQFDDIVGRKTVAALDKELPEEVTPVEIVVRALDIVVFFVGGADVEAPPPLEDEVAIPIRMLDPYISKNARPDGRRLLRIAQPTFTIGIAGEPLLRRIVDRIASELGDEFSIGEAFVFGTSSGGRNAITFTNLFFSRFQRAVNYVAAIDAAFFPNETTTDPLTSPETAVTPAFPSGQVTARVTRKSFFQTAGNHSKAIFLRGRMFSSAMANEEVHGAIIGFTSVNLTQESIGLAPLSDFPLLDDRLHVGCTMAGVPRARADVAAVLNAL